MPIRYIVAYDFLIFADTCVMPLWEISILRIVRAEVKKFGLAVLYNVNQSKKWAVHVP